MFWLCGSLPSLDVHLPITGWRGEDFGLSTGHETLTALQAAEGGGQDEGGEGKWEAGRRQKFLFFKLKNKKENIKKVQCKMYTI